VTAGDGGQVAVQEGADTPVLPFVPHHEGHLCAVGARLQVVGAQGDNLLAVGLWDGAHDGHLGAVVDEGELLDLLAGDGRDRLHEAIVDGILGQGIKQVAHARLVRGMDGTVADKSAVAQKLRGAEPGRLHHQLPLHVGHPHLHMHVTEPLRLAEQVRPEVRVRDGDERHGPLPYALAVQVGHAVLGDHEVYVAPGGDHARSGAQ